MSHDAVGGYDTRGRGGMAARGVVGRPGVPLHHGAGSMCERLRRAWWWVAILAGLVLLWVVGLIDKGGEYPWES